MPLGQLVRVCFLPLRYNLSGPAVEEALYDSVAMREFVGIDLGSEAAADETRVSGDQGCQGQKQKVRKLPANARDFTRHKRRWSSGWVDEAVKPKSRPRPP